MPEQHRNNNNTARTKSIENYEPLEHPTKPTPTAQNPNKTSNYCAKSKQNQQPTDGTPPPPTQIRRSHHHSIPNPSQPPHPPSAPSQIRRIHHQKTHEPETQTEHAQQTRVNHKIELQICHHRI
jgi:hypothetical protein